MKLSNEERDDLLAKIPEWRKGDLSPSEAHKISLLLDEDPQFARDAKREEMIFQTFGGMKADPLPRGLLSSSIRAAVGNAGSSTWLSFDTLLIALGVGIACAGAAQFLSGKIDIIPLVGQWLGSLAGVAVDQSLGTVLGAIALGSMGLVLGGVAWAIKILRS